MRHEMERMKSISGFTNYNVLFLETRHVVWYGLRQWNFHLTDTSYYSNTTRKISLDSTSLYESIKSRGIGDYSAKTSDIFLIPEEAVYSNNIDLKVTEWPFY